MVDFHACLSKARERRATDLYLAPGRPPGIRVRGALRFLDEEAPVTRQELESLVERLGCGGASAPPGGQTTVVSPGPGHGTTPFRLSVSAGLGGPFLAARILPPRIPPLDGLELPAVLERVCSLEQGLVLIIGCAGSGKTTTLASLLDQINRTRSRQVFTLENPVEFRHASQRSRFTQTAWRGRSETARTLASPAFLKRNDLVVLDGLPRADTLSLALETAVRGPLVLASLASGGGVPEALGGLIEGHPVSRRDEARRRLAAALKLALWQHLLPRGDDAGCVPACELLINDPVTAALIRRPNRLHLLRPAMAAARPYGMQTMRQALADLRQRRQVREEDLRTFEESICSPSVLPVRSPS